MPRIRTHTGNPPSLPQSLPQSLQLAVELPWLELSPPSSDWLIEAAQPGLVAFEGQNERRERGGGEGGGGTLTHSRMLIQPQNN